MRSYFQKREIDFNVLKHKQCKLSMYLSVFTCPAHFCFIHWKIAIISFWFRTLRLQRKVLNCSHLQLLRIFFTLIWVFWYFRPLFLFSRISHFTEITDRDITVCFDLSWLSFTPARFQRGWPDSAFQFWCSRTEQFHQLKQLEPRENKGVRFLFSFQKISVKISWKAWLSNS